jgi:ubiquinone/menaquinone biosynthesis C-methylase UbiE
MNLPRQTSYRKSHQAPNYGAKYLQTYLAGYYAAQWKELERPILCNLFSEYGGSNKTCLDFACGTGRILSLASEYFGEVVGVDVSAEMIRQASVPPNVRIQLIDLTRESLERRFDVATAFRFFLNAEDPLRRDALAGIYRSLKGQGTLICNIHMNASSPLGSLYRVYTGATGRVLHQSLSKNKFVRLLEENGFSVEHTINYSFLPRPGRFFPRTCERLILPFETICRKTRVPALFAQSFIVVARKKKAIPIP